MALPNPIPSVQGARLYLGPDSSAIEDTFIINPGLSDYPTGGYIITNIQLRLKLISFAWITGFNQEGAGYIPQPEFAMQQLQSTILGGAIGGPGQGLPFSQTAGSGVTGYTQFFFKVYSPAATGQRLTEVANTTNFLGCGWFLTVRGQ